MAYDIGPKIGIDGESEFRKQLNNINTALKTLGTEMKLVSSEFDNNADSSEALVAKNKVLEKSIAEQKKKIAEVEKALKASSEKYGDNSEKTMKWQQVLNAAKTSLNKFETELNQNENALRGIKNKLDDAKKSTSSFGDMLKAAFTGGSISGAVQSIAQSVSQVIEETKEYRKIMGSLKVSSEAAGYTAKETAKTYSDLYGVLADDQTAATATANLQALKVEQDKLDQIVKGAIGGWAKYGDSIPIDLLAESVNETVKANKATGAFSDLLVWAGTNEDEFNAKLAQCASESERVNLVLEEMASQGLMDAADAWNQNNASLVESNKASAELQATLAEIAARLEPITTFSKEVFNNILSGGLSILDVFQAGGVSGVVEEFGNVFSGISLKAKEQLPEAWESGKELIGNVIKGIIDQTPNVISNAGTTVINFLGGIVKYAPSVLQGGIELLGQITAGVIRGVPKLIGSIPGILSDLKQAFLAIDWPKVGKDIISGIANGLKNAGGMIIDAAKEAAKSALNAAKDFLGIKSPSRRFRDEVGKESGRGIKVGFIEEMKISTAAMKESLSGMLDNMAATVKRPFGNPIDYDRIERMQGRGIYINGRLIGRELKDLGVVFE